MSSLAGVLQPPPEPGDDDYEPTGSGRIPGSKYTITEIDILECTDKKSLEKCVKEHNATSRGESSCCGGKGGLLVEWSWVPDLGKAAKLIRSVPQQLFAAFFPRRASVEVGAGARTF